MADSAQFCTFFVDKHFYGINVIDVQEVIKKQAMTPVPLADSIVQGLINLRGQIVTAIDLRRRFGLPPRDESDSHMNVVVKVGERAVSLLVDEIGDVLEIEGSRFEEPPQCLEDTVRETISGVYKLDEQLMLSIDIEKIVSSRSSETISN